MNRRIPVGRTVPGEPHQLRGSILGVLILSAADRYQIPHAL